MYDLRTITAPDQCREVWEQVVPRQNLSDLWEVRACFQKHFQRPHTFIVAEDTTHCRGLLPLSWIEESQCYGYFPGETWSGKTWLEQNRIHAQDIEMLDALLAHCPAQHHIRYLLPLDSAPQDGYGIDEIGYLFLPPTHNYDIENYFQEFSHKSAKRLKHEIADIEAPGVTYRYDEPGDFDHLVRMSLERFGDRSYFADPRFLESFRDMAHLFAEKGWLRFTSVLIKGELAAVDMGCVFRGTYTLLGGGTSAEHPGVAKLINLHHIRRACSEHLELVDFLCGDFSWKKLFHLTPRPLYLLSNAHAASGHPENLEVRSAACV